MQINGKPVAREYRDVTIPRKDGDITLRVHSIPLSAVADFDKLCPRPLVPTTRVATNKGETVVENFLDPKWQAEVNDRENLKSYHRLWCALHLDPNVKFSIVPDSLDNLIKLREEIRQSGLSDGDLLIIFQAVADASNISNEQIEKSKSSF